MTNFLIHGVQQIDVLDKLRSPGKLFFLKGGPGFRQYLGFAAHEFYHAIGFLLRRHFKYFCHIPIKPTHGIVEDSLGKVNRFTVYLGVLAHVIQMLRKVNKVPQVVGTQPVENAAYGLIVGQREMIHVAGEYLHHVVLANDGRRVGV